MSWLTLGWQVFAPSQGVLDWLEHARPAALGAATDAQQKAHWLRHGGTWFVGVDVLGNDPEGRVGDGPPLACPALTEARQAVGPLPLHPGQVSVTYPGYPGRDAGESDAAHRFRRLRDGAHLDGLLPIGAPRRRHLCEYHGFILGLPLTPSTDAQAPLVVWEGSHRVIAATLGDALGDHAPDDWHKIDLTDAYGAARKAVFETCPRRVVTAQPGAAILLHRMILHGIAPWAAGAEDGPDSHRAIVYFRPQLADRSAYLSLP